MIDCLTYQVRSIISSYQTRCHLSCHATFQVQCTSNTHIYTTQQQQTNSKQQRKLKKGITYASTVQEACSSYVETSTQRETPGGVIMQHISVTSWSHPEHVYGLLQCHVTPVSDKFTCNTRQGGFPCYAAWFIGLSPNASCGNS